MTKKLMFIVPLVAFVALLVMLGTRLGKPSDITTSTALDKPLPAFDLPLLSDTKRRMSNADLPKSPFILNVWGSWCPTCRVEHPFLLELQKAGVPMVGVNYKDELPDALAYLNEFKDPFLYSLQDLDGRFALDLGLMGAPESFVIDKDGKVRLHIIGELHQDNWTNDVKPCLDALAGNDKQAQAQACQSVGGN